VGARIVVSGVLITGHPGLFDPGEHGKGLKGVMGLDGCSVVNTGQPGLFDPGKHCTVDSVGFSGITVVVCGGKLEVTGHSGLVDPGKHVGRFTLGGGKFDVTGHSKSVEPGKHPAGFDGS